MPFPIAAAIGGATSLIGSGLNAMFTKRRNNRSFNDSVKFWNMQNQYNHPAAQMQRYRQAGLNPVLPFLKGGGMASGNAGKIDTPNYQTPDMSGIQQAGNLAMDQMYSLEMKRQQIDNMKAQQTNVMVDSALKSAGIGKTKAETKKTLLHNKQFKSLIGLNVEAAREALRQQMLDNKRKEFDNSKLSQRFGMEIEKHEMDMAIGAKNVEEAVERIAMSRIQQELGKAKGREYAQRLKLLLQEEDLNQFELDLNRSGHTKNDEMIWRMLGTLVDKTLQNLGLPHFLN